MWLPGTGNGPISGRHSQTDGLGTPLSAAPTAVDAGRAPLCAGLAGAQPGRPRDAVEGLEVGYLDGTAGFREHVCVLLSYRNDITSV